MSSDLVTVVIPCRNQGRVLEDAVDSVFAQTHSEREILVVDDGSTDPFTLRVLAGFDWPRTKVLRREPAGAAAARNLGLRQARGPFFCCLEAWDRMAPDYLRKAIDSLTQAPGAAFASAWWSTFGAFEAEVRPADCGVVFALAGMLHPAGLVRCAHALEAGGFDEGLTDGRYDHDLHLRLLLAGHSGVLIEEPLLLERCGPDTSPSLPDLTRGFLAKHAALVARHAAPVLEAREALLASVWKARLADGVPQGPPPRHPPELLQAQQRIDELEAGLADVLFQVSHIKASLSWRMTAPFRLVHRTVMRLAGGSGSGGSRPREEGA